MTLNSYPLNSGIRIAVIGIKQNVAGWLIPSMGQLVVSHRTLTSNLNTKLSLYNFPTNTKQLGVRFLALASAWFDFILPVVLDVSEAVDFATLCKWVCIPLNTSQIRFFQWHIMSWCKTFIYKCYSYLDPYSYGLEGRFCECNWLNYHWIISLIKSLRENFIE